MNSTQLLHRMCAANTSDDILQEHTQLSHRGNVYEKMWDILIKLGCCPLFPPGQTTHYEGNVNKNSLKHVENIPLYLERTKVLSKNKGGVSDITLKMGDKWVFLSSKLYADDRKKKVTSYDVEKILGVIQEHHHVYTSYSIFLLVSNKEHVLEKIKNCQSTNQYVRNNVMGVLDMQDLRQSFSRFKTMLQHNNLDVLLKTNDKLSLDLRFHQELTTHKTRELINKGNTDFLWGMKPRSGKTYCVGGLILDCQLNNILIITPAPTETMTQFTDDLFHSFREFDPFRVTELRSFSDFQTISPQQRNILIVSKQLLDGYVGKNRVKQLKDIALDMIVFDECHFHGTTFMAKEILRSYSCTKTIRLYLTATFHKPIHNYHIPNQCRFYWDMEDENLCKKRDLACLSKKHGPDVEKFLTPENLNNKLSVYDKMPDLHLITNMMHMERYAAIKERIKDTSAGFSNSSLFALNKKGDCFLHPHEVDVFLTTITGTDEITRDKSCILERIKSISTMKNSRTLLTNNNFSTQLWFLPFGQGMLIDHVSKCLKERMMMNHILKTYEILIINSKKEFCLKDVKNTIHNTETRAKSQGKQGLILLAGNQLSLGITLPNVDVVFLLNDIMSSDKIFQMMFRCMTEQLPSSSSLNNGQKKVGFVVDMNISRVLHTIIEYNLSNHQQLNIEQKITHVVENDLIHIDADLFHGRDNKTQLIQQLVDVWKSDPSNTLRTLLKKIDNYVIELDNDDQSMLNKHFTSSLHDDKVKIDVRFDEEAPEALQKGKTMTKIKEEKAEEQEPTPETQFQISLTKDVLPYVLPLSCILTTHNTNYDFMEMLSLIRSEPHLLNVFREQATIWWNNPDVIDLVIQIVEKYIARDSPIFSIVIQFKSSLRNLLDEPDKLLDLIDSCLKPKQKEKQEFGEVFTPIPIINDMLDQLDAHFSSLFHKSIFSVPSLTWFDPASGMGNFSVCVFLRLMKGLEGEIVDPEERKQHILEKMLFMSELNTKNVFICKQIFDVNNEHKLNLFHGDTLNELDPKKEWGVEKFDVVMGNPPYNKGGIKSHTGKRLGEKNETIWPMFVEKGLSWLRPEGYMMYINPLSWMKKSHKLHKKILEKHVVWLRIWDNMKSLATINGKIPISIYILSNTMNNTEKPSIVESELKGYKIKTSSTCSLSSAYSVPLAYHTIFNKLIVFNSKNNLKLEYRTKTTTSTGDRLRLPESYTGQDMLAVDTFTIKEGVMVKKTNVLHPDMKKHKLIIANKMSFHGAFIDDGRLGLCGSDKYYVIGDNLELIHTLLGFKISKLISICTKYRQSFLDRSCMEFIPDIRKLGLNTITEMGFYDMIGLTPEETSQVQSIGNLV